MPKRKPAVRYERRKLSPRKRIFLNARDLKIMYELFKHNTLATNMCRTLCASEEKQIKISRRMHLLADFGYLAIPKAQQDLRLPDTYSMVYRLDVKGAEALVQHGYIIHDEYELWLETRHVFYSNAYDHDFAAAYIGASFELGCREKGYEYIPWFKALKKQERKGAAPLDILIGARVIKPDNLFGVKYAEKQYSFFIVEMDMSTEVRAVSKTRTSLDGKILDWRTVIKESLYTQYGVPNLRALIVSLSYGRMDNARKTLTKQAEVDGRGTAKSIHFKSEPNLEKYYRKLLRLDGNMFTEAWLLPDGSTVNVSMV